MIRIIIGGFFLLSGLFALGIATLGMYRYSTMLNRVHVAAKCDTLGALFMLIGLIIFSGINPLSIRIW